MTPIKKISLCALLLAWSGMAKMEAQTVWGAASDGNWNTATSWTPNLVPGVGTNATISVAGTYIVTYDSPMSAASIASLTLGSSTVTLNIGAAGFNVAGASTFVDSSLETININSGGVMTNGTLTMTSRAGIMNVNSGGALTNGTTQLANNNGNDGSTRLVINSGAVADLGTVTIGRHVNNYTYGLNIKGGTIFAKSIDVGTRNSYASMTVAGGTVTNAGNLRLGTGATTTSPQRPVSYQQTGGTISCAGTLDLPVATNYTTWFSVAGASATFQAAGIRLFPNALASASTARFTNSGNIYLGASGFNVLNSGSYLVWLSEPGLLGANADWSGNANLTAAAGTVTFKAADATGAAHNIIYTGIISGSGSLAKTGGGSLTLAAANTYSGSNTVAAGPLVLGNPTALPKGTALTIGGSGTAGTVDLAGYSPLVSGLATAGTAASQLITNSSAVNTSTLTFSNSAAGSTFGGSIAGGSRPIAVTVLGGSLTLSGQNNYAGNLFISNGKLALNNAGATVTGAQIVLSNATAILDLTGLSTLALAAGQSLAGYGSVTGNIAAANCPVSPGLNGAGGTLTISGDLSLNGSVTNQFDLLLDPNAAGNDRIVVGGSLNLSGLNTIKINPLAGSLFPGTYHLITCASVGSGDTNNLQLIGSPGPGLQAAFNLTAAGLDLVIAPNGGADRLWVGDGAANLWDLTSANWLNGGLPDTATNGTFVTFDDSSTNQTVNLVGALAPAAVMVDAATHYIFQGAGGITGTVSFTKTNSGTLTILTTNDYNGVTTIAQGTLQVGNGAASGMLGSGTVIDNGLLVLQQPVSSAFSNAISGTGSLVQSGTATLTLNGSNTFSGGVTINSGTLQIGNGGTPGDGDVLNNSALVFNNSGNNTVNGIISGSGSATLSGSGTVMFTALNTYGGTTTIGAGTLLVNGTNGPGLMTINSGGKLGGKGALGGAVVVNSGGMLSPGSSVGALSVAGNLTANSGAILNFDLGTNSDRVDVAGDLTLSGTLNVTDAGGLGNNTYTLFTYGGNLVMSGLALGTTPTGKIYQFDTSTPGQVNLIVGVIATNVPAFPGALGFGSIVTGGRGKPVYHVTTLADSGAGSFRDAVSVSGRTIVFDVGGYITLNSAVSAKGNLTIAGQTAPGGGIGFKGGEISFAGQANVICRYIRVRPGSETASDTDDALSLFQAKNVILDHCSFEFAPWNNIDGVGDSSHVITNITFQKCIIADPTYDASSPPPQGFGCHSESVGGTWSWFYNVFVNGHNRNPLAKVNTVFVNNVLYNCSAGYTTHTSTPFKHDIVNNYFVGGPASGGNFPWYQIDNNQSMYFTGNLSDQNLDGALNGGLTSPLPGYQGGGTILSAPWSIWVTNSTVYGTANACRRVLSSAGVFPRDELDNLIMNQVKTLGNGTTGTGGGTRGPDGGLYTSQAQTGLGNNGYGTITGDVPPLDSDSDGMPDYWETAVGLDANNANDSTNLTLSGYTQLEIYLNWLGEPHGIVQINTNLDVDLAQYAGGFTNVGGVFSISNVVNGTVTLLPDGHTARYLPPANFTGRASFVFKVAGNDGTSMTNVIGLVVTGTAPPQDLVWRGDGFANTWDAGTTTNWLNGASPAVFHLGDEVTFDDTGSNSPAINLATPVSPGGMTVAAAKDYAINGAGGIAGAFTLNKSGTGSLTLNTTNTYSGGTLVSAGTLVLGNASAAGSGSVTLNDGTLNLPASDFVNPLSISGAGTLTGNSSVNNTLKAVIDGSGTWTIHVPSGRMVTQESDNSAFAGTIALSGTGTYRLNPAGSFAWGNSNCVYDLGSGGTFNNRAPSSTNLYLGALTGGYGSVLSGSDQSGSYLDTVLVGYLNLDSVFNGSVRDGTGATAHQLALTKVGSGTLTLNGTNTASGATTVSSGTLLVNGLTGTGTATVANGAALGGLGILGGSLAAQTGSLITPGATAGSPGTLSVAGNLSLTGASLIFDFASSTTAGNGVNDLISLNGGGITLSGTSTVVPHFLNGTLATGSYTLVSGGSATTGTAANLAWGGVNGSRRTIAFDLSTPGTLQLQVGGTPAASLVWSGTNGNNWDLATINWLNGTAADRFYNLDTVQFDDTSTNGNVAIAAGLQPSLVIVSNLTQAYTFTGNGISGSTALQKFGAAALTIAGSNNFSGGTLILGGDIYLADDTANQSGPGTGPVTLAGGTLNMFSSPATTNTSAWNLVVPASLAGRLNADTACNLSGSLTGGGTLNLFIPARSTTLSGDWSAFTGQVNVFTLTNGDFRIANPSGLAGTALNLSNNLYAYIAADPGADTIVDIGALSGTATATLGGLATNSTGANLTWRIGARNVDATFAGNIIETDTNFATAIEKTGSGIWTLTGSNTYSGDTTISAGTLLVNNPAGSGTGRGDVTVAGGATLGGSGAIAGSVTLQAGASLAPGNPTGTLSISNNLSLDPAAILNFELGSTSDQIDVGGSLILGGTLNVTNGAGFGPGTYILITCQGALGGALPVIGPAPAGYTLAVNTNTAGQLRLVVQAQPLVFGNIMLSDGSVVLSGSGGQAGSPYYVLTSTNLDLPLAMWPRLLTNVFDLGGNFNVTNPIDPGSAQSYFLIQLP